MLLQLKHRQLAPSLHSAVLNPNIDFAATPFVVQQELAAWPRPVIHGRERPRIAGISSFGAGGANAHVVVEEYMSPAMARASAAPAMVLLSARDEERLRARARELLACLATPDIELADLAYTLQVGREAMDERLALLVHSLDELRVRLAAYLAGETAAEGLYLGQARRGAGALAALAGDDDMAGTLATWFARGKYDRLLDLWTKGLHVDWQRLHGDSEHPRRISLPTYPFAGERHWFPMGTTPLPSRVESASVPETPVAASETLLFRSAWSAIASERSGDGFASHFILLCGLEDGHVARIRERFPQATCLVAPAEADLAASFESAAATLLEKLQALSAQTGRHLIQVVVPREGERQALAGLDGMLRTARLEHPRLVGQLIAVEAGQDLVRVLQDDGEAQRVRYVRGERQASHWVEARPATQAASPWKQHGVYLITGGAGGLGLIFARAIAREVRNPVLVLTGRSAMDETIKGQLRQLEALGAVVRYHAVDVADADAVAALVRSIPEEFESLDGIVHSAGVVRDSFLVAKTRDELHAVLRAKVAGTLNLDRASHDMALDAFICFSSIAAVTGSVGQADYAAANAFMDAFVHERAERVLRGERRGRTLSIDWPLWAEGGMQVDAATRTMMSQQLGMHPLSTEDGLQALRDAWASDASQWLVVSGDAQRIREAVLGATSQAAVERPGVSTDDADRGTSSREAVWQSLATLVSSLIKVKPEDLDGETTFSEYGFDSVSLTEFGNALNQRYQLRLTPTVFFEHSTLDGLVDHLVDEQGVVPAPPPVRTTGVVASPSIVPVREPSPADTPAPAPAPAADEPIAIVGISGRFPHAADIDAFWQNLRAGRDCIDEIPPARWDWRSLHGDPGREAHRTHIIWGGFIDGVDEFDPMFFGISPKEAELMDPQQRLMMIHVWKALEDAGYAGSALAGSDTAIYVGTGATGYGRLVDRAGLGGEAYASTGGVPSVGPNRISFLFDWHGPSEPVETACSSSLIALARGVAAIRRGDASVAVVGGVNTIVTPEAHISFSKAGMLSADGRCKTFSADANGYVRGEGVAMLVLKKRADAERDGDHIYGLVRGVAENHGGHANSLTAPNPTAQAEVIRKAHRQAGIDPRTVTYIEAHGTGTRLGDPIEVQGLKAAFGGETFAAPYCGLGSVKTNIGHLELAAGVAGVVKVLLQMKHRTLVKSLHSDRLNPYLELDGSPFYVVREAGEWAPLRDARGQVLPRRAGVSSFGFGGVNAHVVLEEYLAPATARASSEGPVAVLLSARDEERLREQVRLLLDFVTSTDVDLADLAYTLQLGRETMEARLAVVVRSMDELRDRLRSMVSGDGKEGRIHRGVASRGRRDAVHDARTVDAWIEARDVEPLLEAWVQGLAFDWRRLYGAHTPRRISLPTYPFARGRYWVPDATVPSHAEVAEPVASGHEWLLLPTWQVVEPKLAPIAQSGRSLIVGGSPKQRAALLAALPDATALEWPALADIAAIEYRLRASGSFGRLVWLADVDEADVDEANADKADDDESLIVAQERGVVAGFRLVKALLALGFDQRALDWTIVTVQTQAVHGSDTVAPRHAAVHGFAGAVAKEFAHWRVRLLDLPREGAWPVDTMCRVLDEHRGATLAWRGGQWFRQVLSRMAAASVEGALPYREGGVYIVVGGAGGIGQAWSEHMIRSHRARIVWLGRRAEDDAITRARNRLGALGPAPLYIAADASDRVALERAREEVLARYGTIHGVVHAAIDLLDKSVAQMDEERLRAGLSAKVVASVRIGQVFGALPLDFMLFFSSLAGFVRAAGQGNYAAGCTFKDAYALHLAKCLPYPVKVINWGYWGSVGVVASNDYRERMARQGIGSIEPAEGMRALDRLLRSPVPQIGFLKATREDVRGGVFDLVGDARVRLLPARFDSLAQTLAQGAAPVFPGDAAQLAAEGREIDRLALTILRGELQALGLTDSALVASRHARWLQHSLRWIAETPGATAPSLDHAWATWNERKTAWQGTGHVRQAQVTLVDTMLHALPAILQGRVEATAVMFPDSSMRLVEGVYQGNAVADHFNDVLCDAVCAFVAARIARDPAARIRIAEIGAGTGGTSARVMARLAPYTEHIGEYCYTDLSRAFLLHAEGKYGPHYPYLSYRLLDIGSPLEGQDVEAGTYDLAIATNVLHATKDIRESLRNAKALLGANGLLVLNELASCELWSHLTFGLLDGWWLYQDEALRIPGCPSLSPTRWNAVLREEGYRHVHFPAEPAHGLGQQVIVAESDGVSLQKRPLLASVPASVHARVDTPAVSRPVEAAAAPLRSSADAASLRERCRARLAKLVGKALKMPVGEIDTAQGLDRYGMDSILVLELTNALRAAFEEIGIEERVSSTLFFEHPTIDALADHFVAIEPEAMARWTDTHVTPPVRRHPMLHRDSSDATARRYSSHFDGAEFFLADHRVHGRRVLPGVAQLEMARAAAQGAMPTSARIRLGQIAWVRPAVADESGLSLNLTLTPERDGAFGFALRGDDGAVYSQGIASPDATPVEAAGRHDLAALRARCVVAHVGHERCYAVFDSKGLQYGPAFRGVDELLVGEGEVLARISLPAAVASSLHDYVLHPSLLDAALQASLGLHLVARGEDGIALALPFALDAVKVFAPCVAEMWVFVRHAEGTPAGGDIHQLDIDLCDADGAVCVRLEKLSLRFFHPKSSQPSSRETNTDRNTADMNDSTGITSHDSHANGALPATAVLREKSILQLRKLISRRLSLPLEAIGASVGFDEYGLDSILVMELTDSLREVFGMEAIGATLFFEHHDIDGLVDHFMRTDAHALARWTGLAATPPAVHEALSAAAVHASVPEAAEVLPVAATISSVPAVAAPFDVAIVGMSGRYPGANDVHQFWDNLAAGRHSVTEVPTERWEHGRFFDERKGQPGKTYTRYAGLLDDVQGFDRLFFNIAPAEARLMSPQERLFMQEVHASIEDAGYTAANLGATRKIGVFVGVTNEHYATGTRFWSIANRIAHLCNFQGPSLAVDTACSSSLTAIHLAIESLRSGDSEVAIAGGVNLIVAPTQLIDLASMAMLSADDKCKSFAAGADGFVDAEAVGAFVLKPLHRAMADGDHIYGVIKGSAINSGGKTHAYLVPNPNLQAQLVIDALRRAGVDARTVSYVEAQGTGSHLGDSIEVAGLAKAFRQWTQDRQFCAIGSAKSNVGHSESASGFVALSKVLMQMQHRMLAPSLHASTPNPEIRFADTPFFVQQALAPWPRPQLDIDGRRREFPRRAGISSFGAGGANAHLVIEEYVEPASPGRVGQPAGPAMIVLSARDPERLKARAERLAAALAPERRATDMVLADLAYTLQVGREAMEERLALLVESLDDLHAKLTAFVAGSKDVDDLYQGQAKRSAFSALADDEDMQVTVQAWVAKGKYGRLLDLWVKGFAFDWNGLYEGAVRPQRISLPTYPFARERCWTNVRYPDAPEALPATGAVRTNVPVTVAREVRMADPAQTMMRIWCELLGRPSVARDDDFFELGGHSLLATQLAVRIRDEFGVDLPVGTILEAPTVDALVQHLGKLAPAPAAAEFPQAAPDTSADMAFPLSFAQQRLWFLDQLEGHNPTYNIPAAVRLKGRLDAAALEGALNDVVARHDALRAHFGSVDGTPLQYIAAHLELPLVLHDLGGVAPKEREAKTHWLMLDEARTPFDLQRGPLVRGSLLRLADEEYLLLLSMHHIVSDGWSMGILVRELGAFYAHRSFGAEVALHELPMRYVDFARWQREWLSGEVLERQLGYWKKQLAGSPTLLTLPTDRPRPLTQGQDGAALAYALPAELGVKLHALSRKSQGTLFMTLCAAFNVLLARYSGQTDICIGTPIANRNRSEIEDLIGFFVNTLVLRTQVDLRAGFTDLLKQVRAATLDAYAHQDVQFEQLVGAVQPERHTSYSPLFQVMLVLQNSPLNLALPGLELELVPHETVTAKFDITLTLSEGPQGLYGSFEYNTDLFDRATIERMAGHFTHLLQAIVAEPERPVGELSMMGEAERRHLVYGFNDTAKVYPRVGPDTHTLHQLFEAQVARSPDHAAVVYEGASLSYAELNARANRLARHLRRLGVGPDVLVGLCTERSIEMIVGLYAIVKAGGAYVPLDPTYPADRLATIVEDAAPAAILTQQHLRHAAPSVPGVPVLCLDGDTGMWAGEDAGNPVNATQPGHLAYVIYTSGSTGKPKGVGIDHRGIVNRLQWMQEAYPLTGADRVLQKTPFSFDVSVWEFFWPLLEGATLVVAKPGGHQDVAYLAGLIDAEGITTTHFVPPMLEVFLNEVEPGSGRSLRQVMCSGQALPLDLQQRFFTTWDHVELHNLYGPTEASVDVTYWQCRKDSALNCVPIGKPIANIQIHILDDFLNPVPVGVVGHLFIAGVGLARGYVNRPDLTAQTFIPNPFSATPGARMYLSGDLARYLPDGTIEYLGRSDHQVKIRGLRIELGEIESTLAALDVVRDVVVLARPDERGIPRLVAYLVAHDGQVLPDPAMLRRTLAQTLPDYMVPEYFVPLPVMPLTSNGKVDRKALPAPEMAHDEAEHIAPRTTTEKAIAAVWSELLKVEKVGLTDDFFELGGHSLLATQLVSQLRKRHVAEIELRDLFSHATLGALAAFVDARKQGGMHPNLVPIRAKGSAAPLFLIHPIGGGVQYAFDLAQHLDANQPVYGLAVGETPQASIDDMASTYLGAIREVRPSGPYLLAGWSLGGMVAYEIAHRLLASGEDVQFVGMIDTSGPSVRAKQRDEHPVKHDGCRALLNWLLDLNLAGDWRRHPAYAELMARAQRGDLDGVVALCLSAALVPPGVDAEQVRSTAALYEACGRAADDYRPPVAQLPVTYFAADRREGEDVALGWRELLGRHLEVSRIGGSHLSIVKAPLVEKLARDISVRIARYAPNLSFTAANP